MCILRLFNEAEKRVFLFRDGSKHAIEDGIPFQEIIYPFHLSIISSLLRHQHMSLPLFLDRGLRDAFPKQNKRDPPGAVIHADKHIFSLMGDFTALLDRAATETIPPFREDKAADQLPHRNAQAGFLH